MPRVFISHATTDRAFVEREIIPLLERNGLETWYAQTDIPGASEWERSILQGLRSCEHFLVVMSPRSAQSKWVKREVDWAFARDRPVVPVMLEACDPDDFHFGLAALQYVDFRGDVSAGRQRLLDVFGVRRPQAEDLPQDGPAALTNALGMKLVLVPPGKFLMGSSAAEQELARKTAREQGASPADDWYKDEGPQHEVEITRPFYLGVYPVAVGQFRAFVRAARYRTEAERGGGAYRWTRAGWKLDPATNWQNPGFAQTDDHPVVCVSWNDAQAFCAWLSQQEQEQSYRLPTEAEWEYACRGGPVFTKESLPFCFERPAASLSSAQANFDGNHPFGGASKGPSLGGTSPVGSYQPQVLGLYDMHGNVWEWCSDWYDPAHYRRGPGQDPQGPEASPEKRRVLRGGSWASSGRVCRAAHRGRNGPGCCDVNDGFRVVLVAGAGTG
jgi:formylglycine-generating enzyme required for sulfatase activity